MNLKNIVQWIGGIWLASGLVSGAIILFCHWHDQRWRVGWPWQVTAAVSIACVTLGPVGLFISIPALDDILVAEWELQRNNESCTTQAATRDAG